MAEYLDSELRQTADEGKRLWTLVSRYARLEMVDKLTFILSGLLLGGVLVGIAVVVVFCLSMFCVTLLQTWGVGQPLSYVIMALLLSGAGYAILRKRESLVTTPLLQALLREFFPGETGTEDAAATVGAADATAAQSAAGTANAAANPVAQSTATRKDFSGNTDPVAEDSQPDIETARSL